MTAYDIVNYINELPQKGVVTIETAEHIFFFSVAKTRAEAIGDSTLKLDGLIGFSFITMAESSMMLETDTIELIRHVSEIRL